jgi:hypothetical protein
MKNLTTYILLIFYVSLLGQNEKVIYANKQNNVFMHFKSPISTGIVGNDDFVFIFDSENDSQIGILKILNEKADATNLLVTTKGGMIYSYILEFKHDIFNYNHFIDTSEALNYIEKKENIIISKKSDSKENYIDVLEKGKKNENNLKKTDTIYNLQTIDNVANLYLHKKKKYFEKYCNGIVQEKPFYFKSLVSKNGLVFRLLNIKYNKNELYFIYEVKNNYLMDLDIDYMSFEITSKSLKKRSSAQAIAQEPIYSYKSPVTIKGNTTIRFIEVFEKFTISKKKVFLTTIKEKNGERDIYITSFSKQVNNPN